MKKTIFAIILMLASFAVAADAPKLEPTEAQKKDLALVQKDLVILQLQYQNLKAQEAQLEAAYQAKQAEAAKVAEAIIKTNKWPEGTKLNLDTFTFETPKPETKETKK